MKLPPFSQIAGFAKGQGEESTLAGAQAIAILRALAYFTAE
ncbi:hypothetical protein ABIA16_001764 [Sinorhizobium fredii]